MVLHRTAALQTTNKELETFSYSVSHDLKSPLRAIDGFSRILIDEYASVLPDQAKHYLALVRENAQQMGNLIEHLLAFSRLGRQALKKELLDPAQIARTAMAELLLLQTDRHIEVVIAVLPTCEADSIMLKQVFINLFGNAIKFTKKRELAQIEVGYFEQNKIPVYFVKDNGVGFDMDYVNKLFGMFQRLHRAEDYEGTGIGLANVQRIIQRHGGRIWAEAAIDQGATFYFTLKGENTDEN
jgi:light-regulated signal transduction histidine kinase (bacteriophytochrome)